MMGGMVMVIGGLVIGGLVDWVGCCKSKGFFLGEKVLWRRRPFQSPINQSTN